MILCNINIFWDTEFGVFIICKPKCQEIKAWIISLRVMNLYNIRVSLSEMSDKKLTLFTIFFEMYLYL